MSTQTRPTPSPETPAIAAQESPAAPASSPLTEPKPIPEKWKPLFRELTTYYRHLRKLLTDGEADRFVVVHGDQLYNTWDSCRDALQYGHERFGDQLFMVHRMDPRDVERLAPYFPATEAPCPG